MLDNRHDIFTLWQRLILVNNLGGSLSGFIEGVLEEINSNNIRQTSTGQQTIVQVDTRYATAESDSPLHRPHFPPTDRSYSEDN